MNKKSTTKDELFLLKLYDMALALGSPEEEIDRYAIGRAIGQNDHGIDTIIKHLAQANFIKKTSGNSVYLTPHGIKLVEHLREERFS
jgi:predicted transcriptional regulator